MNLRALLFPAILVVAAGWSSAQVTSQGTISAGGSFSGSASFGGPVPFAIPPVIGAPYSGEEVSESVQVLADGTRITRKSAMRKIWRDSQGRTRSERQMGPPATQAAAPVIVEITDPVAGYHYILDTQNKVAHRQALAAPGTRPTGLVGSGGGGVGGGSTTMGVIAAVPPSPSGAPGRPSFSRESLGTQSMDGVLAEGTRTTTTFPVGLVGNDREFSVTSETWMATDLKVMILSKNNDPRNGETTFRLDNLSRTPPDPSLFMVPADYTVTDETGPFTIRFTSK